MHTLSSKIEQQIKFNLNRKTEIFDIEFIIHLFFFNCLKYS